MTNSIITDDLLEIAVQSAIDAGGEFVSQRAVRAALEAALPLLGEALAKEMYDYDSAVLIRELTKAKT